MHARSTLDWSQSNDISCCVYSSTLFCKLCMQLGFSNVIAAWLWNSLPNNITTATRLLTSRQKTGNIFIPSILWSCQHIAIQIMCFLCYHSLRFLRAKAATFSARLSHCNSVRPSVCLSVAGWIRQKRSKLGSPNLHHGCLEDSSFRNRKAFS